MQLSRHQRKSLGRDQDTISISLALQPTGNVDRAANRCVIQSLSRTKVAHRAFASMDTDTDMDIAKDAFLLPAAAQVCQLGRIASAISTQAKASF